MTMFRKRPREEGGIGDHASVVAIRIFGKMPWKLALWMGQLLGKTIALFPIAKPYRIACINLALCLPELSEKQRKHLARQSLIFAVKNIVAGAISWVAPLDEMTKKITKIENEDLLKKAVEGGHGVIFISPHMGCWEFLNFYLCSRYPLIILAKPFGGPELNKLISDGRSRLQGKVAPTNEKGVRVLLTTLRSGGMTYLTPDHVPKDSAGVFAPFFGHSTTTGILTSRLIQKTGALALAVTCTLNRDNTFSLRFFDVNKDVYSENLKTSVTGVNRTIEECIRACPEQYQWGYRRFKSLEGTDSPY